MLIGQVLNTGGSEHLSRVKSCGYNQCDPWSGFGGSGHLVIAPYDVIDGASVPDHPRLYVLGCYDSRITFYSQQVRALQLAHALYDQAHLSENAKVAVIGGGIAGVTFASALALSGNYQISLFEKAGELIPLQRSSAERRIDPHIYDWPDADAKHPIAEVPILDWKAGPANKVREDVLLEFGTLKNAIADRIKVFLGYDVRQVSAAGPEYLLTGVITPTGPAIDTKTANYSGHFNIVVFAFGFGLEQQHSIKNTKTESYWVDGGIPAHDLHNPLQPRFFVSGNGDGGLIDLVAACTKDFNHAKAINEIINHPGIEKIAGALLEIDEDARRADQEGKGYDFIKAYDDRIAETLNGIGLSTLVKSGLRPGLQIVFQTRDAEMMSVKTATLNRLAAYLMYKAFEGQATVAFEHISCSNVIATPPEANGANSTYILNCDGKKISADKVIVRWGPNRSKVRETFDSVLSNYKSHHEAWLRRLGDSTIRPTISDDVRSHFRELAKQHALPPARHRMKEMEDSAPFRVEFKKDKGDLVWTGDFAIDDVAKFWNPNGKLTRVVCGVTPNEIGVASTAIARLIMHAESVLFLANVPDWKIVFERLTTKSAHGDDLNLPQMAAPDGIGSIHNNVKMTNGALAERINNAMDIWVLNAVDQHISRYLKDGYDPGRRVWLRCAPDVSAAMKTVWARWLNGFKASPSLLSRFFRLSLCAVDDGATQGDAHSLVGPAKLKNIIRSTAVALAVASAWKVMSPRELRPGNLTRKIGEDLNTGHACAADMIDGEAMELSAVKFMWQTSFVLLPRVHSTLEFRESANSSLQDMASFQDIENAESTEGKVPRLSDIGEQSNIIITIDDAFSKATETGMAALTELLDRVEKRTFVKLANAIEKKAI